MHNNKRLMMAEMSFYKDFAHDTRGDMSPILKEWGDIEENIGGGKYCVSGEGDIARLISAHFPYASYEMQMDAHGSGCGFALFAPQGRFTLRFFLQDGKLFC